MPTAIKNVDGSAEPRWTRYQSHLYSSIPRSITGRLVALYALTTFSILVASGVFLSTMLDLHLRAGKTQYLSDEIDSLRAIQKVHAGSVEALRDEVDLEAHSGQFWHYSVRVLEGGQALIETSGMAERLPEPVFDAAKASTDGSVHGARYTSPHGESYLLVSATATVGIHERMLQVAIDTSADEELLLRYRRDMAVVVVLGTLLSTFAGLFIARRGLGPLRAMTARIRGVTATQLHERVGSKLWPAELSTLARAFDDMLRRLELSFERLSQFSADLAHELRTPIHTLMGEAEVALTRSRSSADYRRVLESSREELGYLARIIDSLLFLARAENSETPLERTTFHADAAVTRVCEFYAELAAERGISVSSTGAAVLSGDADLFRRAVSNLVANALEHTGAGGCVTVELERAAAQLEVRVTDNGCGVAPEHLPRLCERFYRVDRVRARGQGSGLGLALVKSIVDLHEGHVDIVSEVGRGTTVRMVFPVEARAPRRAAAEPMSPARG